MMNLPAPIELDSIDLDTVTAAAAITPSTTTSSDTLLQTLNSLETTIQNIGNTANKTGFSTTDVLLLGLLMSQRPQTVFVHRPVWW
jgi:hypothetical protein